MNIGSRIAEFRKKKGATQEQLANFTNVSVAAVSKWETDASFPDITLLPEIASFLNVSIDTLLDYDMTNENIKLLKDGKNQYILNGDYKAGIPVYEDAIRKYPNDFYLNLYLAHLLSSKASEVNWTDKETIIRLRELNAQFRENFAGIKIPNYFNYLSTFDFFDLACAYGEAGQTDKIWQALEKAVSHAVLFDKTPSYDGIGDVLFLKNMNTYTYLSNSSSNNACEPLLRRLKDSFNELQEEERYQEFIDLLETAQSSKKQCGIWE